MKLSKKSRYGLIALVDLSVNSKSGHVALSSIAEKNHISQQYLEQVFASLRRAGIIRSVKGPQGGYLLNKNPEKITVSEILEALEGSYLLDKESGSAGEISFIIQTMVIEELNRQAQGFLSNLTLADLEKEYFLQNPYGEDMYYI